LERARQGIGPVVVRRRLRDVVAGVVGGHPEDLEPAVLVLGDGEIAEAAVLERTPQGAVQTLVAIGGFLSSGVGDSIASSDLLHGTIAFRQALPG